jgi:hypothetical protein
MPPEAQARLLARLAVETDTAAAEAKAAGAPAESLPAYAADALVRLAETSGSDGSGLQTVVHVRVDHAALRRGHTIPGEVCEIEGIGSIPVATALAMSTEALAYAILTNGTDITHIWRLDRTIPRALRIALQERDQVCIVPHCSVRDHLQIHHIQAVTDGGPTSEANCCRPCQWHHYLCTHHGWRIERDDGEWQFLPPAGRDRSPPDELPLAV